MQPTKEQQAAVEMFATGESLAIEAGAGTGKTSTLVLIARSEAGRRGQYIAFNKAIVEEAKARMPRTVSCNTAHSLAYREIGHRYKDKMNAPRQRSMDTARHLGIQSFSYAFGTETKSLSKGWMAAHVLRGIATFCNSADPEPHSRHLPYIDGIDLPDAEGAKTYKVNDQVRQHLHKAMLLAWEDIQDLKSAKVRFSPDHYLKMWQLSKPELPGDYVLFDEAQDASPVMIDVISNQTAQVIWVGDTQQQIYEWRGAVNALASIETGRRTFLTESFRFGPEVAEIANILLRELAAPFEITGVGGPSELTYLSNPKAIICRSNAGAFRELDQAMKAGKRVHLMGGGRDLIAFARGVLDLQGKGQTSHPELSCFSSWTEVMDYAEQDSDGDGLRLMVRMMDEFGPNFIIRTLENMPPEDRADLIVTTAHKAKGREWESVKIAGDYQMPKGGKIPAPELRLLYVAVTRAKKQLDVGLCEPIMSLLDPEPTDQPELPEYA